MRAAICPPPERIDITDAAIVIETLKQRTSGVFRAVPAPHALLHRLDSVHRASAVLGDPTLRSAPLWSRDRTSAWSHVKRVMTRAGIAESFAEAKALRHAFGIEAVLNGVPLNMLQRWKGHARIETTAIYATAIGEEERALARRTWKSMELVPKQLSGH